jgi:nucleotide-binding universal stress UspA family protein
MKILLAVDGSTYARRAARLLAQLPLNEEPRITVLHVVDPAALTQPLPLSPLAALKYGRLMREELQRQRRAADRLAAVTARRLAARWPRTKGEQIIARAKRERSDLILIGSRGLSNIRSFLLGSVSNKVAAHAPCPVLVVRAVRPSITTWLLAADGSASSKAAMVWMTRHWMPGRLRGTALYVWDYPLPPHPAGLPLQMVTDRYVEPLRQAGFNVAPKVVMGHSADQIVKTARRMRADLVVIGSRGLTGLKRVWMGGVSHQVVKHASNSVLVVR